MTPTMTLEQIREAGLKALSRELGPVGLVRFIQQFEPGVGDYTRERSRWLAGVSLDEIETQVEKARADRIQSR